MFDKLKTIFNPKEETVVTEETVNNIVAAMETTSEEDYMLTSPEIVGWMATEEQELLFSALLLFYNSNQSVLDVGCGRADLQSYIKRILKVDSIEYTGIDLNTNLIDLAKRKYAGVNVKTGDILTESLEDKFDWVFGSGLFNYREVDEQIMIDYAKRCIDQMYKKCDVGVAFNLLTGFPAEMSDEDKNQMIAHDPAIWLAYLIETYNKVICRSDYMSGDVTFIIFK